MHRLLVLIVALVPVIWLAAPAAAAPSVSLHVTPTTVAAGGSAQVDGVCEANTDGFALSHAFLHDAAHDFAGVGAAPFHTDAAGGFSVTVQIPASIPPATYDVGGRCGGGNFPILASLTVTAGSAPPTAVPAGSGGLAATTSDHGGRWQLLFAGTGLVLLVFGSLGAIRLRRTTP